MATTADMAKKYNKTADEIKQALVEIGSASAAVRVFKVTPEMERDLDAHFMAAAKPTAKPAARQSASSRHIGTVQITEKKKRTFHRPGKPSPSSPATPPVATSAASATSSPSAAGAIPSAAETAIPSSPPPLDDFMQRQVAAQQRLKSSEATTTASALKTPPKIEDSPPPPPAEAIPPLPAEESPPPPSSVAENGRKAGRGKTIGLDKKVIKERDRRRRQQRVIHSARLPNQHGFKQPVGHVARELPLPETISVSKLAGVMSVKSGAIIRKLMDYGTKDPTPNLLLSQEEAWVLVEEFGHKPVAMAEEDDPETAMLAAANSTAPQKPRPPVVTVMGHVDHGKTSLLDAIRKTRVAAGEAGGITQHIGAYQVERPRGGITFLDTPGHSLFSQMRARGAQITDIVVLVVAADDGVKPQTEEAIAHAHAAQVPIVAAINKMDKPGADVERAKTGLASLGAQPEEWGGDTMVVPLSAHTGDGIDALLDAIHTQSEVLELTAATDVPAQGTVVEASISKGRGVVATIIVRQGILRRNDYVVCSAESGRVRAMWDSAGAMLDEAPPSMPVEIQGLSGIPEVGEDLLAVADERRAREVADLRQERRRAKRLSSRVAVRPMPGLAAAEEAEEKRELNVIVKADMGGSREALTAALTATSGKKGAIKVIHSAVGAVSESDINLARAGDAVVVAFNVRPDAKSRKLAQSCGVKIMAGNVIYELVESAKNAVLELLDAEREEQVIGAAEVKQVFAISKLGNIAGCRVSEGVIRNDVRVRLVRDGVMVYEGDVHSLRHFKEEAEEVKNGEECGIAIRRFNDIKVGDVIEAVRVIEMPPTL